MAPAFTLNNAFDFNAVPIAHAPTTTKAADHRTLLLAPPSLAAHPEALDRVYEIHDRKHADLQMLDRLALGMVSLPPATYDVVMLLTDADGTSTDSQKLLGRNVMTKIVDALKAGGKLKSQDGTLGATDGSVKTEAILAGLTVDGDCLAKPESTSAGVVKLNFGRKKQEGTSATKLVPLNGERKEPEPAQPAGVGFVDFGDDLDIPIITGEDDELIDEDDLLTEEDKVQGIIIRK
jgi:anamorsin